jgi:hypothetical protein
MSERTKADRRRAARYALKTDFYLAFWPFLDRVGKLKDVSRSGAAFEYPVYDDYETLADVQVDIFSSEPSHFLLLHVPCRVVYDIRLEQSAFGGLETRRCGLKFDQLTPKHSEKLKLLLSKFASHQLPREHLSAGSESPSPNN